MSGCLFAVCVLDWLLYYCTTECNRAPCSPTPLPHLSFSIAFSTSFPSFNPLQFDSPPFAFEILWFGKLGTKPINTTAGLPKKKKRWWRRGTQRQGSHCYTLTYIHFHPADWVLRRSLGPITNGGGVQAANGITGSLWRFWLSPYSFQ